MKIVSSVDLIFPGEEKKYKSGIEAARAVFNEKCIIHSIRVVDNLGEICIGSTVAPSGDENFFDYFYAIC